MNNYRITIEPISEQAYQNQASPTVLEVAGYILGAAETEPGEEFRNPGELALGCMHIHAQGTHVPETIVHMIDNLPEHIMAKVAMRILEKRFTEQDDPLTELIAGEEGICADLEEMLRGLSDGV